MITTMQMLTLPEPQPGTAWSRFVYWLEEADAAETIEEANDCAESAAAWRADLMSDLPEPQAQAQSPKPLDYDYDDSCPFGTDLRPAQRWPLADADFGIVHAKVKGRQFNRTDDSCPFGGAL